MIILPTYYTAQILDNKVDTAEAFAAYCVRAFGAFMHQRDEHGEAELYYPQRSTYQMESLTRALADLHEWDALNEEGRYARWSDYADQMTEQATESREEAKIAAEKLSAVRREVIRIAVPESHRKFREFMIDQINETMRYEGTSHEKYYQPRPYGEWVDAQRARILRDIEIYSKGVAEEEKRYIENRQWIDTAARLYNLTIKEYS